MNASDSTHFPFHLETEGVSKRFGGIEALRDIDLSVGRGTVHSLVGQNGAGKSTLGKVIAGTIRPDAGQIRVNGVPAELTSPRDALAHGITAISQELALMPGRTVIDNVFLGFETTRSLCILDKRRMHSRWDVLTERTGFQLPRDAIVDRLRLADQQKVEILRALARNAELIVLDEPTASLGPEDTGHLLETMRHLVSQGTTIVFVSHFLAEVLAVSDVITVLKDGAHVRTAESRAFTEESLITSMLGRRMDQAYPVREIRQRGANPVLRAKSVSSLTGVRDASFCVGQGEIVGVAGLVGSGRSELLRTIYGADHITSGSIEIGGVVRRIRSPRHAIQAGIAMVPESRKDQGLLMRRSLRENVTLSCLTLSNVQGVQRRLQERRRTQTVVEYLDIKARGIDSAVDALSGGNQQKLLFSRCVIDPPQLLLVDEPTRGVDVGAKLAIYQLLAKLAASGIGILMVSSEIEEILGLSDRVIVMRAGRIVTELAAEAMSEETITRAALTADAYDMGAQ